MEWKKKTLPLINNEPWYSRTLNKKTIVQRITISFCQERGYFCYSRTAGGGYICIYKPNLPEAKEWCDKQIGIETKKYTYKELP